jgi:hypothetical protein
LKLTTTFGWVRGEHLGIRSPQPADRLAIETLRRDRSLPDRDSLTGLCGPVNKSPTDRQVLQIDQQIVGALTLRPARDGLRLGRHPWSLLPSRSTEAAGRDGGSETLVVVDLRRSTRPTEPGWRRLLGRSLPSITQRHGARRLLLAVRPAGRPRLDPGPFLQQLSFRRISAPRLTPLLERGFQLRGWRPDNDPAAAAPGWHLLLCWENPRGG